MLDHQIEFSKACAEVYKPISGNPSDPDSIVQDGNPDGIRACDEYEALVHELKETLQPELEMIDTRVIRPALEMLEVVKVMRKTAVKRDHKQIDYDRHRTTFKKLQEKKEKTAKDEKAMYKAEADVEAATQEYNYFNDLLKDELPKLFTLQRDFIQPLFQSFYYMQLNVFYTLHEKMQNIDIGYFDLQKDIEQGFEEGRGDTPKMIEALEITRFKRTGGKRPPPNRVNPHRPAAIEGPSHRPLAIEGPKASAGRISMSESSESAPPPYTASSGGVSTAGAGAAALGHAPSQKPKPPPPKPKPGRLSGAPPAETCTALYDYEAQAQGDLSFSAGETIDIIQRTSNENEWWTGKVGGREGQFPGMMGLLNPFHRPPSESLLTLPA